MFINEIWDFKSINMAHELGIAGEFIYDSARKAMALRNLYNDYELNSILYNGAVGIERLQKIYLCLSIPNPMDKSTVPECLKKHNHNELEKHVKEYSGKCISANGRSLLGLFSEYYNNYRYANYVPGYNSKKLKSLFIGFLKKQNGKFDFEELCTAVQFEPFKRYYINELGKTANYYYSLIDEKAREIGTYTYELDSYSNASRVFWSTQRRSLYKQLILEQEAVKELLIHLYKDHGDSGVLKLFNEMHSLEFDDALINDYLADLCEGIVEKRINSEQDILHYLEQELFKMEMTIENSSKYDVGMVHLLEAYGLPDPYHGQIQYARVFQNRKQFDQFFHGLEDKYAFHKLWLDTKVREHLAFMLIYFGYFNTIPLMVKRIPLPVGQELTDEEMETVCNQILFILGASFDGEMNQLMSELDEPISNTERKKRMGQ